MTQKCVSVVRDSGDAKLTRDKRARPVSATYAPQVTCPESCPFQGSGCYAETGNCGFQTRRLNRAAEGVDADTVARQEADGIDALRVSDGRALRLHVVGDASTPDRAATLGAAAERYRQRGGGPVWTYTHAWREVPREAWGEGVSVLASVETVADATLARLRGYAAAAVVDSYPTDRAHPIGEGLVGVPCPAATGRAADCVSCGLCWQDERLRDRGRVVLFAAHGATRKVRESLPSDAIYRTEGGE